MRTASETEIPIAANVLAARFLTFSSTRMCTIVVAIFAASLRYIVSHMPRGAGIVAGSTTGRPFVSRITDLRPLYLLS